MCKFSLVNVNVVSLPAANALAINTSDIYGQELMLLIRPNMSIFSDRINSLLVCMEHL